MVPSYTGRNRPASNGGPSGVQRSYASQLKEAEALFTSYEHLQGLPRGDAALTMLRRVASLVKPIMRKRNWQVQILAEFLPAEQNLLGLNVNKGYKICIRLRYHNNPDLFLPLEEVVDTMLHELSHNVWGEHDSNFHRLWDELRDEHETLVRKGYTGEGFLSTGHKLGGSRPGLALAPHEMRRQAKASAEKRQAQGTLSKGSGQRLGGAPIHSHGADVRKVIADQAIRRNAVNRGCASGRGDAGKLADQSANNTFKTKAEEDDANDRAIAQALFELMEQEEERKLTKSTFAAAPTNGGLAWSPETGLYDPGKGGKSNANGHGHRHMSEEEQLRWALRDSTSHISHDTAAPLSGLSPVSPLTPAIPSMDRTISAPTITTQSRPEVPPSPLQAPAMPTTRPAKSPDDQLVAKRRRRLPSSSDTDIRERAPNPKVPATLVQPPPIIDLSEPHNPDQWTCNICTCINPMRFLACDACTTERPAAATMKIRTTGRTSLPPQQAPTRTTQSLGWSCEGCGAFMEHRWWTCSACGVMKSSS